MGAQVERAVVLTDRDNDTLRVDWKGDEFGLRINDAGGQLLVTIDDLEQFADLLTRLVIDQRHDLDEAAEQDERAKDATRCTAVYPAAEAPIRCGLAPAHDGAHEGAGVVWGITLDPWAESTRRAIADRPQA